KDDFLIYDRCGRLVYHLGLPYSFLSFRHVEDSIKIAYCEKKCGNCSYMEPDTDGVCENITKKADEMLSELEPKPTGEHSHNRRHGHHHHRHHHRDSSRHPKNEDHQVLSETQRHHLHGG
ncbi:Selenoprotein P, partial [Acanthisitta chloris]